MAPIPHTEEALGRLAEPFARFWTAYPKRTPNPRAAAARAFARLCRHDAAEADLLIVAAGAFAAECRRLAIKPEFIPHARTWLSQRRFLDYPPFSTCPDEADGRPIGVVPDEVRSRPWWAAAGRAGVPPHEFKAFLAPLRVLRLDMRVRAEVAAPSRFVADTVRARYADVLARALEVQTVEVLE